MKEWIFRIAMTALAVAAGLLLLTGCRDKTQTPENQAATAKRQEILRQHKNDH